MPYLALDLDAKKNIPRVAKAAGLSVGDVAWGLLELWELVWMSKSATVCRVAVDGCFAGGQRTIDALVAFGFLAEEGVDLRVKGAAERLLGVREAQSEAGKSRASNLKQNRLTSGSATGSPGSSPSGSTPALTPSTQHPAPSTRKASAGEKPPAPPKPPKPVEPPDPRHAPLVKALVDATPGYKFKGGRDAAAVKALLTLGEPEEVVLRWRRAWGRTGFPEVRELPDLVSRWNHFATAGPVVASAPLEQHTKTGRLEL